MSTVTATYTDAQGNPASGTVYISPAARAGIGQPPDIVTEKRVWADLDAGGSISIDVVASDDPGWLIDGEMPYLVEERLAGLPFRSYWIGVPDAGVDLADVQQVDPDVAYVPVPGPQGPQGIQGPEGPQGPPGEDFTPTDADARYVNVDGDTMTGNLVVPAPTAANQAAQVTAIDPATGRLAIGGIELGDTGWRDVSDWLDPSVMAVNPQVPVCSLRRIGSRVLYEARLVVVAQHSPVRLLENLSVGWRRPYPTSARGVVQCSDVQSGLVPSVRSSNNVVGYTQFGGRDPGADTQLFVSVEWTSDEPWPTSIPGTAITQPATWT